MKGPGSNAGAFILAAEGSLIHERQNSRFGAIGRLEFRAERN